MSIICLLTLLIVVNKRLDEWVTEESLDTRKVHFPRRDGTSNTGVSTPTPKKLHIGAGGSISRYCMKLYTLKTHLFMALLTATIGIYKFAV